MRTFFAASAALLWALGLAQAAFGQAPAHAKIQALWGAQVKAAEKNPASWNSEQVGAPYQQPYQQAFQQPVQQSVLLATPEELASGVEQAGYPAAATGVFNGGNCPDGNCAPGGYGGYGYGRAGYGYGHHAYPGGPFHGGHYGYF